MARSLYPGFRFDVEDATKLNYAEGSFDVAVSSGCLLHVPEYARAIAEAARVARSHVIFHRTPVVIGEPTKWFRKQAYGVETIEIHFNEQELLGLFGQHGLEVIASYTLDETVAGGIGYATRNYSCRKLSA
jgi:ubiquinone/menaquinone biosynthesis C-methylase UbiE